MKICVYTICKNESQFIERWYNSAKEADYLCVLDTGSTDNTYEKLKSLPIIVNQKEIYPFRFDTARNESMKLIPDDTDLCLVIDLDEYMEPGWRKRLEEEIDMNYSVFLSCYEERGSDIIAFSTRRRFHMNHRNLHWIYPVHEQLVVDQTYDNSICQKLSFTVIHTPVHAYDKQNSTKWDFYKELARKRLEEYKDPLSYCAYAAYIYKKDYKKALKYLHVALRSDDFRVFQRALCLSLIIKMLNNIECSQELDFYYRIEKSGYYQEDPQWKYLFYIWKSKPNEAKTLVKKLIQNPPYNHKNYILSLYRLLWKLEPTFSTYQKIQELL